jgi:hypothetical protein
MEISKKTVDITHHILGAFLSNTNRFAQKFAVLGAAVAAAHLCGNRCDRLAGRGAAISAGGR